MKTVGIQLKGNEAIIVVLEEINGQLMQSSESTKIKLEEPENFAHVRLCRDQIFVVLDSLQADRVAIIARIGGASRGPVRPSSPVTFKMETIFQLYSKKDILVIWGATIAAFLKKNACPLAAKHNYQKDALELAYYLMKK